MSTVARIWFKSLTEADFWNMEHSPSRSPVGGGGQTYIDIPFGLAVDLFTFLDAAGPPRAGGPVLEGEFATISAPNVSRGIQFGPRYQTGTDNRYRILNQQRQADGSRRHPAWTRALGFPAAPDDVSREQIATYLPRGGLRIMLVSVADGTHWAGYTVGEKMPGNWPNGLGLDQLFEPRRGGLLSFSPDQHLQLRPDDVTRPFAVSESASEAALALRDYLLSDSEEPPASEIAREAWERLSGDEDILRERLDVVQGVEGAPVDAPRSTPEVRRVAVESAWTHTYEVQGTARSTAERRESKLVREYSEYLKLLGHYISSHEYGVPGYARPLRCDLFDESTNTLVEAKGGVSRELIRMAIGQVTDYRRFEPEGTTLAILLPRRPTDDLLSLIASAGITALWRVDGGFEENPNASIPAP